MCAVALLLCGLLSACGDDPGETTQSQSSVSSLGEVNSLGEAEQQARLLVDGTVERFLREYPARDDGLGEHACDPIESGEMLYDYGLAVDVPASDIDALTEDIWKYWQAEYGFVVQSESSSNAPPVVLAETDGFRASLTGDPEKALIFIGISSPCFPADS